MGSTRIRNPLVRAFFNGFNTHPSAIRGFICAVELPGGLWTLRRSGGTTATSSSQHPDANVTQSREWVRVTTMDKVLTALRRYVRRRFAEWNVPGAAVGVIRGGQGLIVFFRGRRTRIHPQVEGVFTGHILCEEVRLHFVEGRSRCPAVELLFGDNGPRVRFNVQPSTRRAGT